MVKTISRYFEEKFLSITINQFNLFLGGFF